MTTKEAKGHAGTMEQFQQLLQALAQLERCLRPLPEGDAKATCIDLSIIVRRVAVQAFEQKSRDVCS